MKFKLITQTSAKTHLLLPQGEEDFDPIHGSEKAAQVMLVCALGIVRLRWWSWRVRPSAAVISMRLAPRHQTLRCPLRAGPPENGERHDNDDLAQALQFKCDGSGSSIDSNSGSSRKAGRNTGKRSPMSQPTSSRSATIRSGSHWCDTGESEFRFHAVLPACQPLDGRRFASGALAEKAARAQGLRRFRVGQRSSQSGRTFY